MPGLVVSIQTFGLYAANFHPHVIQRLHRAERLARYLTRWPLPIDVVENVEGDRPRGYFFRTSSMVNGSFLPLSFDTHSCFR